jgi:hypothetical protein
MVPTVKTIRKKNPMTKFKATTRPPQNTLLVPERTTVPQLPNASTGPRMTFRKLENIVHGDIIIDGGSDWAMISAEVTELLNGLDHEDNFVVLRVAKEIAEGIARELAVREGDTVRFIKTLNAALDPMIAWLERHGHNGRSIRQVNPSKTRDQIGRETRRTVPSDYSKAPDGTFTYGEVRSIVREAVTNPSLGRQMALKVLDRQGGGAKNVSSIKPEHLDMVYEAFASLLARERR